jgi:hypothetical protein
MRANRRASKRRRFRSGAVAAMINNHRHLVGHADQVLAQIGEARARPPSLQAA